MQFHIQDPDDPSAISLVEAILEACDGAKRGAGIFAFVSRGGVALLLQDSGFQQIMKGIPFHLVIGLDAITNEHGLAAIQEAQAGLPRLTVHAFLHNRTGTLFHPKMCWFEHDEGGTLVVGSGNLTGGGLRDNWESFAVIKLAQDQMTEVQATWDRWLTSRSDALYPIDDERVKDRASKNVGWVAGTKAKGARKKGDGTPEDDSTLASYMPSTKVLVAEIPRGTAPGRVQANFTLETFRQFFGASPARTTIMFLQHISPGGSLAALETRPSVSVKSRNFRFELGAGKGLTYPTNGRPIAVFVRVASRQFRYQLLMPGVSNYAGLDSFLSKHWNGPARLMRRVPTDVATLSQEWPNERFWSAVTQVTHEAAV